MDESFFYLPLKKNEAFTCIIYPGNRKQGLYHMTLLQKNSSSNPVSKKRPKVLQTSGISTWNLQINQ